MQAWWVYLARCADDTIYCGIATDVERRVKEHNAGSRGARYTRARRPVVKIYQEGPCSRQEALRREREIKTYSRRRKEALAASYSAE